MRLQLVLLGLAVATPALADMAVFNAPTFDRWMYPFNGSPGSRPLAPTFGAVDAPDFDERDGQFYVGFDTSGSINAGHGAQSYRIDSVTLTGVHGGANTFEYDSTYDAFQTYLDSADPLFQMDADAGRPVEIHGAGFRDGATFSAFGENGGFGGPGRSNRDIFPTGFIGGSPIDISNHVDSLNAGAAGFNTAPWAIGQAALAAGADVMAGTVFVFNIDVSDLNIHDFLAEALNAGELGFVVSSGHAATFGGAAVYPQWATKENLVESPLA